MDQPWSETVLNNYLAATKESYSQKALGILYCPILSALPPQKTFY